METRLIDTLNSEPTRIGLGTTALADEIRTSGFDAPIRTIRAALEKGINVIDTAPLYGLGAAETAVGRALKEHGRREDILVATKAGIEWKPDGTLIRNSSRKAILREIDESLKRLQTDYVDIYFVHWPDKDVSCQETADVMNELFRMQKIRSIGVANFTSKEIDAFRSAAPVAIARFPLSLFEREEEDLVLPYCRSENVATMTTRTFCRGLLAGEITPEYRFPSDDHRLKDPRFREPNLSQFLEAARKLDDFVRHKYGRRLIHLAVRWALDRGADIALWNARRPEHLDPVEAVTGLLLADEDFAEIDRILLTTITHPVGPDFMAPLTRTQYLSGKP